MRDAPHLAGSEDQPREPPSPGDEPDSAAAIRRESLLAVDLSPATPVSRLQGTLIDLPPGRAGGRHLHPVPVAGYVVSGEILFEIEGRPAQRLVAGDAFFEPAHVVVRKFDNASVREHARFVAFYLLGAEDRELIRMLPDG